MLGTVLSPKSEWCPLPGMYNALQKELDTMQRRSDELTALFKRLYEDNVLGRITNEQFRRLSADYNAEQKTLEDTIPVKQERLQS